jgi:hypothetical protein
LPSDEAPDHLAGIDLRRPRLDHSCQAEGSNRFAEPDGRQVVRTVVEPTTHRRIDGDPQGLQQQLTVLKGWQLDMVGGEVVHHHLAARPSS